MNFHLNISQEFEPLCDRFPSRLLSHPPPSTVGLLFVVVICSVRKETDIDLKGGRLPREECGKSRSRGRIVGGKDAYLGEFPWMALVGEKRNTSLPIDTVVYICGGSLITDRYVLTAAHCLLDSWTNKVPANVVMFKVSLGAISRSPTYPDRNHRKIYDVVEHIVPYNYKLYTVENDIALLKLDEKVSFNDYMRPICLPYKEYQSTLAGEKTVVAGWGRTAGKGSKSLNLKKVDVTVMDLDQCKTLYQKIEKVVDERVVCARGVINEYPCDGDSGGPLMWKPKDVWTQVGVVSWGSCESAGYPSVYTRISAFMGWILENLDI